METAYLAAGCFWGVEHKFSSLLGVTRTAVGYMGGNVENPTYEMVCSKKTGHAEVVEVCFDPTTISFDHILRCFFNWHDPTQKNRQGFDVGKQYRSAVFPVNASQKIKTEQLIKQLNEKEKYNGKIVTSIEENKKFWKAEEYHQKYIKKRER